MEILDQTPDTLFDIREVKISMPPKARMETSVLCDKCKEPTMGSKLEPLDGQSLCRGCLAENATVPEWMAQLHREMDPGGVPA